LVSVSGAVVVVAWRLRDKQIPSYTDIQIWSLDVGEKVPNCPRHRGCVLCIDAVLKYEVCRDNVTSAHKVAALVWIFGRPASVVVANNRSMPRIMNGE
jgi:hypothetical protein